jgi:nitrate/TMAO reductase-like tetraheme cytochrome c subunit
MKFANLLRGSDWFFLFPKMYYKEKARHAAIVISMIVGMLITGTSNTILSKFQTRECVLNCDGENKESFEQPMWQTLNMFVGEMLC